MRQNSMLSTFLKVTKAKYVPLGQVINFSLNCYRLMESVRRQIIRKANKQTYKQDKQMASKKKGDPQSTNTERMPSLGRVTRGSATLQLTLA